MRRFGFWNRRDLGKKQQKRPRQLEWGCMTNDAGGGRRRGRPLVPRWPPLKTLTLQVGLSEWWRYTPFVNWQFRCFCHYRLLLCGPRRQTNSEKLSPYLILMKKSSKACYILCAMSLRKLTHWQIFYIVDLKIVTGVIFAFYFCATRSSALWPFRSSEEFLVLLWVKQVPKATVFHMVARLG